MTQLRYPIQSDEYNMNGLTIMLLLLRVKHVLHNEIELRILLCASYLIYIYPLLGLCHTGYIMK